MPMTDYDEIADWYEHQFLGGQASDPARDDGDPLGIGRALRDLLGEGSGICLEIGCGTGVRATHVSQLGWTPVGVNLSAGMLGYARGRLPVVRADARTAAGRGQQRSGCRVGDGPHRHAPLPGGAARGSPGPACLAVCSCMWAFIPVSAAGSPTAPT